MPYEINAFADKSQLALKGRLGVQQAGLLWDSLQPVIASAGPIDVLAEGVEEIDTSIVQILLRLSQLPNGFEIITASSGLRTSLQCRGLASLLIQRQEVQTGMPPSSVNIRRRKKPQPRGATGG